MVSPIKEKVTKMLNMDSTNSVITQSPSYGKLTIPALVPPSTTTITNVPGNNHQTMLQRLNSAAPNRMMSYHQQTALEDSVATLQTVLKRNTVAPEDALEYFIRFPSPNQRNDINVADSDFVFVYGESNVPVVLLLGWAGCQDRYLMKYSKIYEDRGLITVRYTAPVDTLFWNRAALVPIGEKILKLMYDMNFESNPIIVHIFSNGGAYLYQHILLAMHKHKTPIQIQGMIFDSAPGERRMLGLYRAVTAIYGKEKRTNNFTAIFITLALSFMWFVEETFEAFKSLFVKESQSMQTNPFNGLKNEPSRYPQMFLYSKGDVVIPYQDVEKFMQIRKQQGINVSSLCFEDAEHVKIYTKYPTQYVQSVCSFINNCLSMPCKASCANSTVEAVNVTSKKQI